MPRGTLRTPGVLDPRIIGQSANEGGKMVSPTHQLPLKPPTPEISLVHISIRGLSNPTAIVEKEGLSK
jgi:hypothetical protein